MVDQVCLNEQARSMKHGSDPLAAYGFFAQHKNSPSMRYMAITVSISAKQAIAELKANVDANPCVIGVSENAKVFTQALDPLQAQQLALPIISHEQGEKFFFHPLFGIRAFVNVGVIDSGVQLDHPDLVSRLWRGPAGERGFDFVNGDADPSDDFGHGTHVSGLIAGQRDNGIGIRGIMGDWSRIMPVKSQAADGSGDMADVINGIRWAVDQGADVINLSLSSRLQNAMLKDALEYALDHNVTVVVAAGNDGEEVKASNFISPIGYAGDHAGIIGVGSVEMSDLTRSNFSNYGPNYVEISAPGAKGLDGILSTYFGGSYRAERGTSMSAPQVAGAAALVTGYLKTHSINYSPAMVEELIEASASERSENQTYFSGGRLLNIERLGRFIFNSSVIDSTGGFDD